MEKKTKIKINAFRSTAIKSNDDKECRTFSFPFMTDAPCDNWFVPERCLCGRENVDLTRFNAGVMPVLFNHDRDKVIGKVDSISFDEAGQVRATITLDDDDESNRILGKINSGSIRGISVGYERQHTIRVSKGTQYDGETYDTDMDITDRWAPFEISVVSLPADPGCAVGRDMNAEKEITIFSSKGEPVMDPKNNQNAPAPAAQEPAAQRAVNDDTAVREAAERARQAEHARITAISAVCRQFGMTAEFERSMIDDANCTIDEANKKVLEELSKRNQATTVNTRMGEDAGEKFHKKAVDGLALHYGVIERANACEGADAFAHTSLRSLAEICLSRDGYGDISDYNLRLMDESSMFERMFGGFTRAMGTEQFVSIVDEFANKTMLKGYTEQPTIYQNFVSKGSNKDFKPSYKYRIGLDGEPELMSPESDEFAYQTMKDERVQTGISTYGKAIALTREIFINDDMGTVVKAIAAQAAGFARLKEKMFFDMLLKKVPFDKKHGNICSASLSISVEGYAEARKLMHQQKDSEGKAFIGVYPAYILASDDASVKHEQLLHSTSDPAATHNGVANPMQNRMTLFTSPYLSGNAFYAIGRPQEMEGIELTTLNGVDRPMTRTVIPSTHLGIEYQMWTDFGFNLIDYRPFVLNPVA